MNKNVFLTFHWPNFIFETWDFLGLSFSQNLCLSRILINEWCADPFLWHLLIDNLPKNLMYNFCRILTRILFSKYIIYIIVFPLVWYCDITWKIYVVSDKSKSIEMMRLPQQQYSSQTITTLDIIFHFCDHLSIQEHFSEVRQK